MRAPSEVRPAVLRALTQNSQTAAQIAERVGFTEWAVRWVLRDLYARGIVERERIEPTGGRPPYGWRRRG